MSIAEIHSLIVQHKALYSVAIFVAFFLLAQVLYYIFKYVFLRLAKHTKTPVDDLLIKKTSKPVSFLLILIGLKLALLPLASEIEADVHHAVGQVIYTFIILVITYMVIKIVDTFVLRWGQKWADRTESKTDDQLVRIISRFSRILLALIGALFMIQSWGVQIGPLLASLGIAGIAVAFALQASLSNVFGGISLIMDKSIKAGDMIKLDEETSGTVLDVGLRSTKIRTFDNEVIIIPNGKLADSRIQNFVHPDPSVRVVVPFSVAYGSDVEKVKKTVLKIPHKIGGFIEQPEPFIMFHAMANSSLDFRLYFWVDSYTKRFAAKDAANTMIYNELSRAGLTIPFPQMDVHLKKK